MPRVIGFAMIILSTPASLPTVTTCERDAKPATFVSASGEEMSAGEIDENGTCQ